MNEPGEQIELLMPDKDVEAWEYAVLVSNSTYALDAFGQLYRDRADCENGFDELKNQWGWGHFELDRDVTPPNKKKRRFSCLADIHEFHRR